MKPIHVMEEQKNNRFSDFDVIIAAQINFLPSSLINHGNSINRKILKFRYKVTFTVQCSLIKMLPLNR